MLRGLEELVLRRLSQGVAPARSLLSTPIRGGNPEYAGRISEAQADIPLRRWCPA